MTSPKLPTITWETGIRHEALRILYYLHHLPSQSLQNRGFLVLPALPSKDARRSIIIPHLPYEKIKNIWKQTRRLKSTTPMHAPESLINEVADLLRPTYQAPQKDFLRLKNHWQKTNNQFFTTLFSLLPDHQNIISQINFFVTFSGTVSQFNTVSQNKNTLTIYCRADADISDIFRVTILSLIREQTEKDGHSWTEIETISDFLLTHTPLNNLFSKSTIPMMNLLRQKQTGPLYHQSVKYQSELGIPLNNNWSIKSNEIYYLSTPIKNLTDRQTKLLKLLIDHQGQTVGNDQIADTLWPSGENYSLWAIVKEIARIRHCITESGLPASLLQSHRKVGYILS